MHVVESEDERRGTKERGDERRKKMGVLLSINFKKYIEGVSSGMLRRVVNL